MKVFARTAFRYPASGGEQFCGVEVYRDGDGLLVVLGDHGELEPVMEMLAWEVSRRVLEPRGLAGLEKVWLHGDRVRGRFYEVAFADEERFAFPLWREASADELEGWAEDYGLELHREVR